METTISERRGSQNLSRPFPWAEAGNASAQPAFPKPRERGFTAAGTGSHLARRKGEAPNPRFSVTSSCGALDFASEGPLSTCVCLLPRGTVCSADCVFNKLCHPEAEKGCVTAPAMTPSLRRMEEWKNHGRMPNTPHTAFDFSVAYLWDSTKVCPSIFWQC
ncbi:uncharacterized protein LOC128351057 isoform X2 [Hemicordylus capensis]|uniref:uncharacterized protein LOC128351057 isoform X2 n=1 Tax=Hemicordylus capensis TaxID=884348 RepID=UPI002303AAEC|nr:uncharacterized protein LOC128351057 isoform X2 [Hemicordylus capensis]